MTQPLTCDIFSSLPGLRHAFFTRAQGNGGFSAQENPADVFTIRAAMAAHLEVEPPNLLSCHQIHSTGVVTVTEIWQSQDNPKADAMVTQVLGVALGVLTADCVPVLFADAQAGVIGAAHAGWRGALGGILENTLNAMERLGARRSSVVAALGPCIWQNSYEVGPEFPAPFIAEQIDFTRFFMPAIKSGHYMFDLPGYVVTKLRGAGVDAVAPSPADTCAAPERFFSFRHSTLRGIKREGNLMSAITLRRK